MKKIMNDHMILAIKSAVLMFGVILNICGIHWVTASEVADGKARNHLIIKEQYMINDAMLNGSDCQFNDADLESVFPDRQFGTESSGNKETIKDFLEVLCKVHRRDESKDLTTEIQEGLQRKITNIVNTRSFVLKEGEKNVSTLMQGLIACNQAAILQKDSTNPTKLQGIARVKYCQARRHAITIFHTLNLGRVDVGYEHEPANGGIIGLLQACYQGDTAPLGSVMASQCGEQSHLSNAEIDSAIEQEYDRVSDRYLGGSGQITAMLNRKVNQVASMREKIESGREALQADHTRLQSEYQRASTAISAQDKALVKAKMQEYQQAVATAMAVTKTLDGWKRSLLFDNETQTNYVDVLTQKHGIIMDQQAALQKTSALLSSAHSKLKGRADPNQAKRHILFSLCRVHYCEHQLPPQFPIRFTPLDAACTEDVNRNNPLCTPEGRARMANMCRHSSVNFPSHYMPPATRAEGIACRSLTP